MIDDQSSLNPLHCGAVVASRACAPPPRNGHRSQSPSLRGSGRFVDPGWALAAGAAGLNPLHCGAVVASRIRRVAAARGIRVSIPFIAGQWSLRAPPPLHVQRRRESQSPSLRGSGRFTLTLHPVWR